MNDLKTLLFDILESFEHRHDENFTCEFVRFGYRCNCGAHRHVADLHARVREFLRTLENP